MAISNSFEGGSIIEEKAPATKRSTVGKQIDALVMLYQQWLTDLYEWPQWSKGTITIGAEGTLQAQQTLQNQILSQQHIDGLCQRMLSFESHPLFKKSGHFISQVVQRAYDCGENDLTIVIDTLYKLDHVGYSLTGTKERPLFVTFDVFCGQLSGASSTYTHQYFKQDTGIEAMAWANMSTFFYEGSIIKGAAVSANNCRIYVTSPTASQSVHAKLTGLDKNVLTILDTEKDASGTSEFERMLQQRIVGIQ